VALLIVGAIWVIAAAVLGATGRKQLQMRPLPQTVETLKEDVQWAKQQMS
jgi:hypothetical protein